MDPPLHLGPRPSQRYIEARRRQQRQSGPSSDAPPIGSTTNSIGADPVGTTARGVPEALLTDREYTGRYTWGLGLTLNGGGNKALSGGYGILRGLYKKGALDKFDVMAGVSGGFWTTAIYCYAFVDDERFRGEGSAEAALLDLDRPSEPESIVASDLDRLADTTLGYSAVRRFGCRELLEAPWYGCLGLFSRMGCGGTGCHDLWTNAVYRSFLAPYAIPRDKFILPSEQEASAMVGVAGIDAAYGSSAIWPRLSARSASNPDGGPRGPEPFGIFSVILPAGIGRTNGLDTIAEMQVEAASGGLTEAIASRAKHNGVTPIPYWSTSWSSGTHYQAVYVPRGETGGQPLGPTYMSFPNCEPNECCRKPAPVRFDEIEAATYLAVPKLRRPCCYEAVTSDKLSLEALAGFSSAFIDLFLNPGSNASNNFCLNHCLNPLLARMTGRIALATGGGTQCRDVTGSVMDLPDDVRTAAICDIADGAVMDNTGIASTIAAAGGTLRSVVAMITPGGAFRPPPNRALDTAKLDLARLRNAGAAVVQKTVQAALSDYISCLDADGNPALDWGLASLFGVFSPKHVEGGSRTMQGLMSTVSNQVLDSGRFPELLDRFTALYEAGRPLVATVKDIKVVDNPFYGTSSVATSEGALVANTVDLTVIYYSLPGRHGRYAENKEWVEDATFVPGSWADRLPEGLLDKVGKSFPHLLVAGENIRCEDGFKLDAYSNAQVNLFGHLGDFIVLDAWEEVLEPLFRGKEVRCGPGWKAPARPSDICPARRGCD